MVSLAIGSLFQRTFEDTSFALWTCSKSLKACVNETLSSDLDDRLEELIKRIGEKSAESLETNLERLVDILDQEISAKKEFILNSLVNK